MLMSLILMAALLGLIPDREGAILEGRVALAEAVAVNSSAFITRSDIRRLQNNLQFLVERNQDLLSAAVRRADGKMMVSVGEHETNWTELSEGLSIESQIQVPLWSGQKEWGRVELRFVGLTDDGWLGYVQMPLVKIIAFLSLAGFLVFYIYLKKMLKQLDPSQAIPERVRSALDTMAEGLLVLDRKEQIVLANESFANTVGRSPLELLGFNMINFEWTDTEGEALDVASTPWHVALDLGEPQMSQMVRLQTAEMSLRTFMVNCSPVLGAGDKAGGVLISFDDVTELEEKEIELRRAKDEAEEANQSKSDFLANMSHEIRTPMNAILGFTEVLRRGYGKSTQEDSKHYLDTIHRSGTHLLGLINDILDLSKVEAGQLEVEQIQFAPHEIISEVVNVLGVKAEEKGITLSFEADGPLPEVIYSDPGRLRQIVTNLIGNSIKFTEQGGVKVVVRLSQSGLTPMLEVDIIDSGIGMTQEQAASIFNPFVQADSSITRRFGGTGLGLAISLKFAKLLGGDITVNSEPGKGSTFKVTLETGSLEGVRLLSEEEIHKKKGGEGVEDNLSWIFPPAKVLVIDDGPENRELVILVLEGVGLSVDAAENGEVGVRLAGEHHYDAILMDVQMPVMDGFTATGILREKGLQQPIVALTGNAMKGFEKQCLEGGFTAYMAKPIDINALIELLADFLGGRQIVTERNQKLEPELSTIKPLHIHEESDEPIYSRLSTSERYQKIITNFVTRIKEQMGEMEQSWSDRDYPELAKLAHWLKGSGGSVGFDVLTEPAKLLETAAKSSNEEDVLAALEQIRNLVPRLSVDMKDDRQEEKLEAEQPEKNPVIQFNLEDNKQGPVVSRLANNQKFHRVISHFVERLYEKMMEMEKLLEANDYQEIALLAHWLKGAGGSVGFDLLSELAIELEDAAKISNRDEVATIVRRLRGIVDRVVNPADNSDETSDSI